MPNLSSRTQNNNFAVAGAREVSVAPRLSLSDVELSHSVVRLASYSYTEL